MPIHTRSGAVYGFVGVIASATVTATVKEESNIPAPLSNKNTNMTLTVEDDAITTDADTYYDTETSETYVERHDDEETYYPSDDTETVVDADAVADADADALTVKQRWQALKAKIAENDNQDDSASIENIREVAHILHSMFRSRRMTTTQQEEDEIPTDDATITHRYMLRTNVVRDYKEFYSSYGEDEGHEVVDGVDDDDDDDETFSIGSITTVAEDDSDSDSDSLGDSGSSCADADVDADADDDADVDDELYNDDDVDDDTEQEQEQDQDHYHQLNKRLLSREIKRQINYDTGVFRKYLKQYANSKDTHGKRTRILHILQYFTRHPLTLVQSQRIRKVIKDKVTEFSAYISVYNYRKKLRSSTDMLARVAGDCVIACAGSAGAGSAGACAGGNTINIKQQLHKYEKQDKLYHAIGKACATLKQIITDIEMCENDESYGRSMRMRR